MEKDRKDLSIVIPAYLEAENLRILLPRIVSVLREQEIDSEVLVVDTLEPKDDTERVCREHAAVYVRRQGGNNYGDAVRTGIAHASGAWTIFMDADGSHTPEFIPELWKHRSGADVVVASRYVEGGDTDNKKVLILMSLSVNIIYRVVLGLKCKDVSNSFKLYRTADLKNISLQCNNFDIVEEMLFKVKRVNRDEFTIFELPYTFKKRMFGETKRNLFLFMVTYLVTLVRLRLK